MVYRLTALAAACVLTGGTAATARAALPSSVADCLSDATVVVPRYEPATNGYFDTDPLALTPTMTRYGIMTTDTCFDETPVVTVQRPDGTGSHDVALDRTFDQAGGPFHHYAYDELTYATGTGPWRISRIKAGSASATLTKPVSFTIKRASTVTLSVRPATPSSAAVASGTVKYWTYQSVEAPVPGRRVNIRRGVAGGKHWIVANAVTDRNGRFAVRLPAGPPGWDHAEVASTSTLGWDISPSVLRRNPTYLTGIAAPTTATVIRPGTKMSTFGHLKVATNAGRWIAAAGQRVVVQTRPKADPSTGYTTVATATTSGTGYYYTNWNATVDADVRVAFLSPYQTINSTYRWLRAVDVQ